MFGIRLHKWLAAVCVINCFPTNRKQLLIDGSEKRGPQMCLFVVSQYCETGSASEGPTCSYHGNQTRENLPFKKVLMPFLEHLKEADMQSGVGKNYGIR